MSAHYRTALASLRAMLDTHLHVRSELSGRFIWLTYRVSSLAAYENFKMTHVCTRLVVI